MEAREKLNRINPWKIDLVRELETIRGIFKKDDINFIIAGYAAENASFIYDKKIDTIDKITSSERKNRYQKIGEEILIRLPDIKVGTLVGKTLIDLSDLIDKLDEIIERRLRLSEIPEEIPTLADYYEEVRLVEDIAIEIGNLLKKAYQIFGKNLLLTEVIKTLDNYSPYIILFALLFLYVDNEIDIEIIEEDGVARDIIITPII